LLRKKEEEDLLRTSDAEVLLGSTDDEDEDIDATLDAKTVEDDFEWALGTLENFREDDSKSPFSMSSSRAMIKVDLLVGTTLFCK